MTDTNSRTLQWYEAGPLLVPLVGWCGFAYHSKLQLLGFTVPLMFTLAWYLVMACLLTTPGRRFGFMSPLLMIAVCMPFRRTAGWSYPREELFLGWPTAIWIPFMLTVLIALEQLRRESLNGGRRTSARSLRNIQVMAFLATPMSLVQHSDPLLKAILAGASLTCLLYFAGVCLHCIFSSPIQRKTVAVPGL